MTNFFASPQISQVPNPEPPGYNLIRQMMLNRIMQQFTNPYGMSPGGMQNWQGFNTGSKPFDPTGGFSGSSGASGGYNYLTNQGMPSMGGVSYTSGPSSLSGGPMPMGGGPMGSGGGMGAAGGPAQMPGAGNLGGGTSGGQQIGGMTPSGSGGSVAALLQALLSRGGTSGAQAQPTMPPSAPRTTFPTNQQTSNYDGNVVGYGGQMYGASQSHGALPHLLGLLRMAHTQPRGPMQGPPGMRVGRAPMPTSMPSHGMAMPIPMQRGR